MTPMKVASGTAFDTLHYPGPMLALQYTSLALPAGWTLEALFAVTSTPANVTSRSPAVVLNSPHLEAYENVGIAGLPTSDRLVNYGYLAALLQKVQPYFATDPIATTP